MTRPEKALAAVDSYSIYGGPAYPNEPLETKIVDLLADLMHLCKEETINFHDILQSAQMHFDAEA